MTRPTARVLTLLELLQSGGIRTVAELASRLGVDERTVRRYAAHLIDLDIPVESVRGRHGGYRLARGHRLPPLMFTDDEALAVLLGLTSQAGAVASETAAAKLRRVLPARLAQRLDAVFSSLTTTEPDAPRGAEPDAPRGAEPDAPRGAEPDAPRGAEPVAPHGAEPDAPRGTGARAAAPDGSVLLPLAAAVRDHQPVRLAYAGRGERILHPYGLVVHSGRWYVIGLDTAAGEERTLRLDRISEARGLPGTFVPPADFDPAARLLTGFATAAYRHTVRIRAQATADQVRAVFPASVAVLHEDGTGWLRIEIRAERLDWIPARLAALGHPFVIEHPPELRDLVAALADRLATGARRPDPPV
ncbi:putative DNA-binding transcriptional regulator YafY [Actinoplanes octamycinicus]|uniref:Putative DNA-binding transcriptional regulator YafY n=1 Tax=Actinoplanes octamycinicus TaxID=135948 RepID=A0A7W7MBD1_9ACTN|nr:WYL domain-containing protein [Actinoplanes octamycinicus]MBB4743715.1 putative DNA-binding transcriptional regulator YafY [Actinoplanes octamycinicus]